MVLWGYTWAYPRKAELIYDHDDKDLLKPGLGSERYQLHL